MGVVNTFVCMHKLVSLIGGALHWFVVGEAIFYMVESMRNLYLIFQSFLF